MTLTPKPPGFLSVREPDTGKLLFRYDPLRQLVEIQRRGEKLLVDLQAFEGDLTNAEERDRVEVSKI